MIQVSDEWKELHNKPLLPETFVEIRLQEVDDTVGDLCLVSGQNLQYGDMEGAINNMRPYSGDKYVWLEPNFWALDGSMTIAPDQQTLLYPPCVIGREETFMSLTLSFAERRIYDIPGFTITWSSEYEEYATEYDIVVKNGGTIVMSKSVSDNKSVVSTIDVSAQELGIPALDGNYYYDAVEIMVHGWSIPERRKRIESVVFGRVLVFGKDEILSYSHEQSGDPTSSEISKNEIQFSLDNSDGKWSPLNPEGFGRHIYEQQKLTVYYGLMVGQKIEWVQAGVFYLSEWSAPSNGLEASFTARDILGPMLSTNCNITARKALVVSAVNIYDSVGNATNYAEPNTGVVGVTTVGEIVDVHDMTLTYPFENQPTVYHDALMLIDRGWVRIHALDLTASNVPMSETYQQLADQCSLPDEVTLQVEDEEFNTLCPPLFIKDTSLATYLQLCGGICGSAVWQDCTGALRFAEPSWELTDYVIRGDMAYSYPEVELSKPLKEVRFVGYYQGGNHTTEVVHSFETTGETVIVDNPYSLCSLYFPDENLYGPSVSMLGVGNIDRSLEPLARMWRNRTLVTGEFRADPRLELFDVVQVETKFGTVSPVMITRIKYSYNGAFHGSYEGKVLFEEE